MSTRHPSPSDRPVASDGRVDRAGAMENACDAPCRHDHVGATRFHSSLSGTNRRSHAPPAYSL